MGVPLGQAIERAVELEAETVAGRVGSEAEGLGEAGGGADVAFDDQVENGLEGVGADIDLAPGGAAPGAGGLCVAARHRARETPGRKALTVRRRAQGPDPWAGRVEF